VVGLPEGSAGRKRGGIGGSPEREVVAHITHSDGPR
jgi:hypothetical protein